MVHDPHGPPERLERAEREGGGSAAAAPAAWTEALVHGCAAS
jgi:hypothetical protein